MFPAKRLLHSYECVAYLGFTLTLHKLIYCCLLIEARSASLWLTPATFLRGSPTTAPFCSLPILILKQQVKEGNPLGKLDKRFQIFRDVKQVSHVSVQKL